MTFEEHFESEHGARHVSKACCRRFAFTTDDHKVRQHEENSLLGWFSAFVIR